ncbi:MAG: serine hydrolase domain-containing protein [Polyangiaceae bacterium]
MQRLGRATRQRAASVRTPATQLVVHGYSAPEFVRVRDALWRQLKRTGGGAAVSVYYQGECVVDVWGGVRDETGRPWERDTLSVSFSTTKGVASTALHLLVDRGLVDYDAPVARYWPEFAQAGKTAITVRQLMSHQAGLYGLSELAERAEDLLDWELMVARLAAAAPAHRPGSHSAYHALTYGFLVGEIVRRVSGRPFSEFIRTELAEPLELDGLYIGAPDEALARAARLMRLPGGERAAVSQRLPAEVRRRQRAEKARRRERVAWLLERGLRAAGVPADLTQARRAFITPGIGRLDFSDPQVLRASIPAANGLFTARSLAKLYAALAGGGQLAGVRLISERTLRRATEVQTSGSDRVVLFPMRWRLGYHFVGTSFGVPKRAFGHFGFGGSGAWADPTRNLSFAMVLNSGIGTPFGDLRTVWLSGQALRGADRVYRDQRRR